MSLYLDRIKGPNFCILDDIQNKAKILLIHHNDKYGEVVKKNLEEAVYKLDILNRVDLSFLWYIQSKI